MSSKHIFLHCLGYFALREHPVHGTKRQLVSTYQTVSQVTSNRKDKKMAFGPHILGYVAMSYEDLVAEYREAYWALQNLALP